MPNMSLPDAEGKSHVSAAGFTHLHGQLHFTALILAAYTVQNRKTYLKPALIYVSLNSYFYFDFKGLRYFLVHVHNEHPAMSTG